MRINDGQKTADLGAYLRPSSSNKGAVKGSSPASAPAGRTTNGSNTTDNVELSTKVQDLQQAMRALESTPEIREGRVKEIKVRINSGTYSVKGQAIADRIISSSLIEKII